MNPATDMELVDAYVKDRSEAAFHELVSRHVDAVYSAAMRQLRNPHEAEEAVQAAFIALARKAPELRRGTVVAGWLHKAVHFAARNLRRGEARRRHWEEEAAMMHAPGSPEPVPGESALPWVDGALAELTEAERDAIVLRFLRKMSLREVGIALGTTEDAAKKRVGRALERLRGLLLARGVTLSVSALGVVLIKMPSMAAPPGLSAAVASHALAGAAEASVTHGIWAGAKAKWAAAATFAVLAGASALLLQGPRPVASANPGSMAVPAPIKLRLTSLPVDDQARALAFYTEKVGFVRRMDLPLGAYRWLTVASSSASEPMELLLEPMGLPASRTYQTALREAGIPVTAFTVHDLEAQVARMTALGVVFRTKPVPMGPAMMAVFEDTCGNLVQLVQPPAFGGAKPEASVRIRMTSVPVDDQEKALRFYTGALGFVRKHDVPAGGARWLTVTAADEPDGVELLLEPMGFPAARVYQNALRAAGVPVTALATRDVQAQYERLTNGGVVFQAPPARLGMTTVAVFDDTCGNWIQLYEKAD